MKHTDPSRREFLQLAAAGVTLAATEMNAEPIAATQLTLAGVTVTPHLQLESMRYRRAPEPAVGARVQLFLRHAAGSSSALEIGATARTLFGGKTPAQLLNERAWAWHDTPSAGNEAYALPPDALTVWTFNGRTAQWGAGSRFALELGPADTPWLKTEVALEAPRCWTSAVTFLAKENATQPETMIVHIANETAAPMRIESCRLWLAANRQTPRVLLPQAPLKHLEGFNGRLTIPARDKGGFTVTTPRLPLSYCVVEITLAARGQQPFTLWSHLRIKPERFDISGGWVNNDGLHVTSEAFLKTLKRLHLTTAHLSPVAGYSDTELYARYPLKYFSKLQPFEKYDADEMLPRIHAVEFLGEPQYGGGRPVPPQEVWQALAPYAKTRLATTLTHSEERIWRDYAGLSDYPHYDAYRVTAPSPDDWRQYDRWDGARIGWGAPLETIGEMGRSLRELNRPLPCACWSQGPHSGWGVYGGRQRTTPTPAEIRLQAYHALSTRITSLYWFNLGLKSLVTWRDTLDELGRIGREIRLVDELLLEGDAYRHQRLTGADGKPDWDLASVCGQRAALLFALDLRYQPDPQEKVFRFGPPRAATWTFALPEYLGKVVDVFRLDADGLHTAQWTSRNSALELRDRISQTAVFVATPQRELRATLERKRQALIAAENALGFDPARNDRDFAQLAQLATRR